MRMVVPANWRRLRIAKRCDFWATHREAYVKGNGDLRSSLELFDPAGAIKIANQIADQPRSTVTPMMDLSVEDVRAYLTVQLDRLNSKRLNVFTVDDSLVQRLKVDRHTGVIEYQN